VGFITPKIHVKLGKKRTAFVSAILAGGFLLFMGMNTNIYMILGSIFLASSFFGIASILIQAVFENYVARMDIAQNDLVSLNQFSLNAAYSIGPIMLGLGAKVLGFNSTFILVGFFIILATTHSALRVPRKVRLPQKRGI